MGFKQFRNEKNQNVWDLYRNLWLKNGRTGASINQYKVGVHALENALNEADFSNLTIEMITTSKDIQPTKSNHINAFIIDCFLNDFIEIETSIILELIPEREKKIFIKLLK
jgi:hypothetical protein